MRDIKIAYFTMEIGLHERMPTYCGGLGMLAGDAVRSAADLGLPMAAVTLAHRLGYLRQEFDADGRQLEAPSPWRLEEFLEDTGLLVTVHIASRPVRLRVWRYTVSGANGRLVPVLLLDSDVEGNSAEDRRLTDVLYGGDETYRLSQEIILGVGGVRALRALGATDVDTFHMNEGHSALLTLELLREATESRRPGEPIDAAVDRVRSLCAFTTHTPIAAGHDAFAWPLSERLLGDLAHLAPAVLPDARSSLNLSRLAMRLSRYVNGVSLKHAEVTRAMFNEPRVDAVTNGVHAAWWASPAHAALFDRHGPGWRENAAALRLIAACPLPEIRQAHAAAKRALLDFVLHTGGVEMSEDVFTLGFARRATVYKRTDLLLQSPERLRAIASKAGGLQIVYAGKAHPRDVSGKQLIEKVWSAIPSLGPEVKVVYLPDYDMRAGRLLTAGVDLWVNTPIPPLEASGTSGMKAAVNGVPSLSVRDGWWLEGCIEGVTGWSIGPGPEVADRSHDAESLLDQLEHVIVPLYIRAGDGYAAVMRNAIAINGAYFNTYRMMEEYAARAYQR
jgi:glycogen phosphorylase